MAITVGNTSTDTADSGAGPFTFSHNSNTTFLVVCVAYRDDANNTLSVTYNGVSMTSAKSQVTAGGSTLEAEIFYLANPTSGANTVSISSSGSIGSVIGAGAISLAGVNLASPIDGTTGDGQTPGSENPRSTNITTTTSGAMIIDCISDRSAGLTVGGSQTQIFKLGTGDQMAGSYRLATTATSYAMAWTPTENAEDWAQAIVSFKEATGTAVKDVVGAGIIPFLR